MSDSAKPKPEPKPGKSAAPETRLGGIKNAPVVHNTGGYENRVAPPNVVAKMAGHNTGGYENRVIQEAGQH